MYAGIAHLYDLSMQDGMASLGEHGKCLITGEQSPSVILVPVDGDVKNRLYSNLAYVMPEHAKRWNLNVRYTLTHEVGTVHFNTPIAFKKPNEKALSQVNFWDFNTLVEGFSLTEEKVPLLWDFFTQYHVKGIEKIDIVSLGVSIDLWSMLSWQQAIMERKNLLKNSF